MRRHAICEIPEKFTKQQASDIKDTIITQCFDFELITPMFGGDFESWKLDLKNPVRGQSIKGQLRFWWRTMQNETDIKQLLYKENKRWGGKTSDNSKSDDIKSPVSIAVIAQENIKTEIIKAKSNDNCIPNYVLFPVIKNEQIHVITQLKFSLLISFPKKYQREVMDTLTLWTLFGGVGARTRRGTGSLYCAELMNGFSTKADIKSWINELSSHKMQAEEYARLTGSQLFFDDSKTDNSANSSTNSVFKLLLEKYGSYRQDRREGNRRQGNRRSGRSYWPEPDAIRKITSQYSNLHRTPVNDENWFPRAAFGLPILTTFFTPDDPTTRKAIHLEPVLSNLKKSERFPSPMILKVIKLTNGRILSCCFVLNQKFPEQLKLTFGGKQSSIKGGQLPFSTTIKGRKMKTNEPLSENENIYQHLAHSLGLEEEK